MHLTFLVELWDLSKKTRKYSSKREKLVQGCPTPKLLGATCHRGHASRATRYWAMWALPPHSLLHHTGKWIPPPPHPHTSVWFSLPHPCHYNTHPCRCYHTITPHRSDPSSVTPYSPSACQATLCPVEETWAAATAVKRGSQVAAQGL